MSLGVEIIETDKYEDDVFYQGCSEEEEDYIRNDLGDIHENLERRARDAKSIATVLRIRGSRLHPKNIVDANIILITRNINVAKRTRNHLIVKKILYVDDIAPALTDSQFAGILWFAVGGNIGALSHKKLIANCSFVMHPKIDVITKVKSILNAHSKVTEFEALMRDQRVQRCLVHTTLGFPSAITPENADQILEELKRCAVKEKIKEFEKSENELRLGFEQKYKKLDENLLNERTENLELKAQIANLKEFNEKIKGEIDEITANINNEFVNQVKRICSYANRAKNRVKWEVITLYSVVYIYTIIYMNYVSNKGFILLLSILLGLLGFWIIPNRIFGPLTRYVWKKEFDSKIQKYGFKTKLEKYNVNYKCCSIENLEI